MIEVYRQCSRAHSRFRRETYDPHSLIRINNPQVMSSHKSRG